MSPVELLVFESKGAQWGIERAAVRGFAPARNGFLLTVGGATLRADRILGFQVAGAVRTLSPILRRFWSLPSRGLAVVEGRVVVVIDPVTLPPLLAVADDGGTNG